MFIYQKKLLIILYHSITLYKTYHQLNLSILTSNGKTLESFSNDKLLKKNNLKLNSIYSRDYFIVRLQK